MAESSVVELSPDQVRALARSAGLELGEADLAAITPQLNQLRHGVASLSELNLQDVEPAVTFDALRAAAGTA